MKKNHVHKVKGKVWLYPGESANWHFFSIQKKLSSEIKDAYVGLMRGWGSLPVLVTFGKTEWTTSIFLDRKSGTFILPLKAQIRKKEGIYDEDLITISFKISL